MPGRQRPERRRRGRRRRFRHPHLDSAHRKVEEGEAEFLVASAWTGVVGGDGGDDGGERRSRGRCRGRTRQLRRLWPDSAGGEGEEEQAEVMAASARSGEAQTGGAFTATVEFLRWSTRGRSSARSRVSGEEESEGREEKQRASWWPYQRWGGHGSEAGEEDTAMRRPWRQWVRCRHSEDGADRRGPPVRFSFFSPFLFLDFEYSRV